MYYTYEALKSASRVLLTGAAPDSMLRRWYTGDVQKTVCGGAAGVLSKVGTMPFDVVRKRLQIQHSEARQYAVGGAVRYDSVRDCIGRTLRTEGVRGFFRGLAPALLKTAPASAVTFVVFERVRDALV
eukprot:Unigene16519_Nuclearia_a/m.48876 Unigene16519_Nuclearia_a/g.48876  ORF Unigene16519_Nuclearia_a/g.48876 Unigene16519_Nuclearia_a/m.48876 type:complete len:128 (+) Unigene16519_Nuclearia_a:2-385(+)